MIKGGYYIKARKISGSKIANQPPYVREIWDWLLREANHIDKKYAGFLVKRGQLFRTYKDIREGLAWYVGYRKMMYNENQTKKGMKALRKLLMIATKKELGGVLITIINYDKYQNPKNYESTKDAPNESTTKEPMKNHTLPDNNKNDKNDKNDKELNTSGALAAGDPVNLLICNFKILNPSYKTFFANKTQRGACDRLLKEHGLEKLVKLIGAAAQCATEDYAPLITTPLQMELKLAQLIRFYQRKEINLT